MASMTPATHRFMASDLERLCPDWVAVVEDMRKRQCKP